MKSKFYLSEIYFKFHTKLYLRTLENDLIIKENKNLTSKLNESNSQLEIAENCLKTQREQIKLRNEQIRDYELKLSEFENRNRNLNEEKSTNENKIISLENEITENKSEIKSLSDSVSKVKSENEKLAVDLEESHIASKMLKNKNKEFLDEMETQKDLIVGNIRLK